jgi:hypothetical protein
LDVRTDSPVKGVLEFLAPKHRSMDSRFPGASETGLPSTPALQMKGSSKIDEEDEELEEFYDAFQDMSSSKSPMRVALCLGRLKIVNRGEKKRGWSLGREVRA